MKKNLINKCVNKECGSFDKEIEQTDYDTSVDLGHGFKAKKYVVCEECMKFMETVFNPNIGEPQGDKVYMSGIPKSPKDVGKNYYGKKDSIKGRWM